MVGRFECRHLRTDGFDDAREVRAEGKRQGLRQGALAGPDPGVPGSDSGCLDPDKNLALARLGFFMSSRIITSGGPKR
jgi:hypothetical protein